VRGAECASKPLAQKRLPPKFVPLKICNAQHHFVRNGLATLRRLFH